jgi:hypothetical protein
VAGLVLKGGGRTCVTLVGVKANSCPIMPNFPLTEKPKKVSVQPAGRSDFGRFLLGQKTANAVTYEQIKFRSLPKEHHRQVG